MPIHAVVDRGQKLIRFTVVGELVVTEMVRIVGETLKQVERESGYDILSDHRQIASPATPEQIKQLIGVLAEGGTPLKGRKAAMIVSQAASYGMMRLLGVHASGIDIEVGVFWNIEDAMRFLKRPPDPDGAVSPAAAP